MVRLTRGKDGAGTRARTGKEWMVGEGSSVRTRPSPGTGSKSSGGRGRRFVRISRSPVPSSPSARWSVDGNQRRD